MLANHSHERLIALGLTGMAKAWDDQQQQPDADVLTFEQRLGLMIDREVTERENRRLITRLKFASLRQTAIVEDIDLRTPRGIDRAFFAKLVDGDWIDRKHNLLITGPTGTGKSWIACALGHKACRDNRSVLYHRLPRLFEALALARGDGRYARLLKTLSRVDLLILDDWGLAPFTGILNGPCGAYVAGPSITHLRVTRKSQIRPRRFRPGRRVNYDESGCGDTQPPIPAFAGGRYLMRDRRHLHKFSGTAQRRSKRGPRLATSAGRVPRPPRERRRSANASLARLLRSVRGPPLVLSDIVPGHELRRQKLNGRSRRLPIENADGYLHGAARHEERVLRGGGLDLLRPRILERGLDIGCAIDRGDDDAAALLLARREVGADGLRVVDGKDGVDLGKAGQIALRHGQATLARPLGVLVAGQDLEAGILGEHILAADHPVDHHEDLRPVLDDHIAFAAELVDDVLAGDLASLDIVCGHRGVGAFGCGIHRDDDDACRLCFLDRWPDGLRIAGVQEDQVDAGGDEVVDLGHLLAEVVFKADRRDLHIGIGLSGFEFGTLRQSDEKRVAQRAQRDADRC